MGMKDYKMTACLKQKKKRAPQPAEFLASISARYCFDILGLGLQLFFLFSFCFFAFYANLKTFFCIKVSEHLFRSNLFANEVPFVMVRCFLTVLINENYYCTFNLNSF